MKKYDHFENKSKTWDMSSLRVKNAQSISDTILNNINLKRDMEIIDYGAGTGLLSYFIAPSVGLIVAVDSSPSMLHEFREKIGDFACEIEIVEGDISDLPHEKQFDGIISSMTLHHIEDISALLKGFYSVLKSGGFIALADLDREDGSFHSDDTGIFHHGFDREELRILASEAGFENIEFVDAGVIKKPHKDFPVFVMFASKG